MRTILLYSFLLQKYIFISKLSITFQCSHMGTLPAKQYFFAYSWITSFCYFNRDSPRYSMNKERIKHTAKFVMKTLHCKFRDLEVQFEY